MQILFGIPLTASQRRLLVTARGDLTQVEVARRAGCRSQTLNQIERGRKLPSEKLLKRLCKELGIDVRVKLVVEMKEKAKRTRRS